MRESTEDKKAEIVFGGEAEIMDDGIIYLDDIDVIGDEELDIGDTELTFGILKNALSKSGNIKLKALGLALSEVGDYPEDFWSKNIKIASSDSKIGAKKPYRVLGFQTGKEESCVRLHAVVENIVECNIAFGKLEGEKLFCNYNLNPTEGEVKTMAERLGVGDLFLQKFSELNTPSSNPKPEAGDSIPLREAYNDQDLNDAAVIYRIFRIFTEQKSKFCKCVGSGEVLDSDSLISFISDVPEEEKMEDGLTLWQENFKCLFREITGKDIKEHGLNQNLIALLRDKIRESQSLDRSVYS